MAEEGTSWGATKGEECHLLCLVHVNESKSQHECVMYVCDYGDCSYATGYTSVTHSDG